MMPAASALTQLAATGPDPEDVTPGLLGFLVVAGLALAVWLLLRSMNRRLRNVDFGQRSADDEGDADSADSADSADGADDADDNQVTNGDGDRRA